MESQFQLDVLTYTSDWSKINKLLLVMDFSSSEQYEYVDEENIASWICPVCLCALVEPRDVSCCRNTFCLSCIDHCIKANAKCPICQEAITSKDLHKCSRHMIDHLDKLQVYCPNCRQIVLRSELKSHISQCGVTARTKPATTTTSTSKEEGTSRPKSENKREDTKESPSSLPSRGSSREETSSGPVDETVEADAPADPVEDGGTPVRMKQWLWEGDNGAYVDYEDDIADFLERKFDKWSIGGDSKVSTGEIQKKGSRRKQEYIVDFDSMTQVNTRTNFRRRVKRVEIPSSRAKWVWFDDRRYVAYSRGLQIEIEGLYRNFVDNGGPDRVNFRIPGLRYRYVLDFTSMKQINVQTRKSRDIERRQEEP